MKKFISFILTIAMSLSTVFVSGAYNVAFAEHDVEDIIARIDDQTVYLDDVDSFFSESTSVYGFVSNGAIYYATGSSINDTNIPSEDAWYLEIVSSSAVRGINMYITKNVSMTNSGIQLSPDENYGGPYRDWENSLHIADNVTVDLFTDGSGSDYRTGIKFNRESDAVLVLGENSRINIGKSINFDEFVAGTAHTVSYGIAAKNVDIVCPTGSSIIINSERDGLFCGAYIDNYGSIEINTFSESGFGINGRNTNDADVIITGGNISINSHDSYVALVKSMCLTDCTFSAINGSPNLQAIHCLRGDLILNNSNVDIKTSTVAIDTENANIIIENGSVLSIVDSTAGITAAGNITVDNSSVSIIDYGTGSAEDAVVKTSQYYDWHTGTHSLTNLTIADNSFVEIVSQNARCISVCGGINIENSIVTAKALGTNEYSEGITADKTISFGEDVQLYAAGSRAASAKEGFSFVSGKCFLGSSVQNDAVEPTQAASILNNAGSQIPYMGTSLSDPVAKTVIIGNGTSPTPTPPPAPVYYDDDPVRRVIVPVFGNENRVKVYAELDGTKATIEDIRDEVINQVIGDEVETGIVHIDLTGLNQTIKKAVLEKTTLDKIADAVKDSNNDATGLEIDLTTAKVRFDAAATLELQAQAKGSTLWLVVDNVSKYTLNEAQKKTADTLNVAKIIDAYLVSDGLRLCTADSEGLGYGKARVMLPYKLKTGEAPSIYTVYYLDDEGVLQELDAVYNIDDGCFEFDLEHFSNYIIAYTKDKAESFNYMKCPQDTTCCIYPFWDSDPLAWYHDGVHYCIENGLMVGYPDHSFHPLGGITRAEAAMTLWRIEGCPTVNDAPKFKDVSANEWYTDAVCWASAKNVMDGSEDGIFCPSAQVTREELAVILYDYAKYKGKAQSRGVESGLSYTDAADLSVSAEEAVKWCAANGIVRGKDDGLLAPKQISSRAESAAMFQRTRELLVFGKK